MPEKTLVEFRDAIIKAAVSYIRGNDEQKEKDFEELEQLFADTYSDTVVAVQKIDDERRKYLREMHNVAYGPDADWGGEPENADKWYADRVDNAERLFQRRLTNLLPWVVYKHKTEGETLKVY